ncbi:MAG: HNH endonuclease [Oligoflexales bacterium]|nr:HNH endonuclease [Oligoflexales bacterium]
MLDDYETRKKHIQREKQKAKDLRKSSWWDAIVHKKKCSHCQTIVSSPSDLTMDHIVPLSKGGYSSRGNLVASCKACNTKKRDRTTVEWILEEGLILNK